jgi:hypothetical protein
MPLFGFADIKFDKGSTSRKGPLNKLVSSEFEKTTLRYPIDVGNYDKAHYLVFYIRQQKNTAFKRTTASDNALAASGGASFRNTGSSSQSSFGSEILNKINSGLGQINQATGGALGGVTSAIGKVAGNVTGQIDNLFGGQNSTISGNGQASTQLIDNSIKRITNSNFLNTTVLTTDAIALYMPDTLQYSYSQSYDQLSLGGELGGQALAAGSSALEAFKSEGGIAGLASAGGSLFKSGGLFGAQKIAQGAGSLVGQGTAQVGFTAATGAVQNPMLEMIYKSPNFRTFQFDFTFYPRDEREAYEVQRIIERIRFHQAPEFAFGTQGFLVPPSEFDIKFYYGGAENPNIPQIATCVLTTIDVNYAPNGFAAYEVPNENFPAIGRTGMPVAIQLTLQFQEITYLTKRDFTSDKEFEGRNTNAENVRASQAGELR